MSLSVIILAAGQGRRMRSARPKVLADLAGQSLLAHAIGGARSVSPNRIRVVVGHGGEAVRATLPADVEAYLQPEQRGTGDAVASAMGGLPANDIAVVLYGDVPLVQADTLKNLVEAARRHSCAVLTVHPRDPTGYGRIVRDDSGAVVRIVEERDAGADERAIEEVNTGLLAMRAGALAHYVAQLDRDNAQGEYYLTDVVERVAGAGGRIEPVRPTHGWEVQGVNNRRQLADLERAYQHHLAGELMDAGATLRDPGRVDIRGRVTVDADALIDVGAVFEGRVHVGAGVVVGPHCVVRDSTLGAETVVDAHSVVAGAAVGAHCRIGPFARLRPSCALADGAKIGNFVEAKETQLGPASKINHLAYVGDTEVGRQVNIGAGVITCNYDGYRKHRTVIEDGAFIGSDCQLIAPVTIGAGATIGAGSTITRDAPAGELSLGRARQRTVSGWVPPARRDSPATEDD